MTKTTAERKIRCDYHQCGKETDYHVGEAFEVLAACGLVTSHFPYCDERSTTKRETEHGFAERMKESMRNGSLRTPHLVVSRVHELLLQLKNGSSNHPIVLATMNIEGYSAPIKALAASSRCQ